MLCLKDAPVTNRCIARVIKSERTGMGKSLYIRRLTRKLRKKLEHPASYPLCVTIPIHGPNVDLDVVMKSLLHHAKPVDPPPQIFHFDIAPTVRFIIKYHNTSRN